MVNNLEERLPPGSETLKKLKKLRSGEKSESARISKDLSFDSDDTIITDKDPESAESGESAESCNAYRQSKPECEEDTSSNLLESGSKTKKTADVSAEEVSMITNH